MDPVESIINNNIEDIQNQFEKHVGTFSLDSVVEIIPECIEFVEAYKSLSGLEKKQLVVEIIKHLIDTTDGFGSDDIIDPLLKKIVPPVIDSLIGVEKNRIVMKKKNKKCLPKCF